MDALTPFFKKFGNGALVVHRFEEFDMDLTKGKKGGFHLLGGNLLNALAGKTKNILVKMSSLINRVNGYADMVYFFYHIRKIGRGKV